MSEDCPIARRASAATLALAAIVAVCCRRCARPAHMLRGE
jgi:hypothetical protein